MTSQQRTGVLGGTVHGNHPGALLGGVVLLDGVVDRVGELELLEGLDHVLVQRIVHRHACCLGEYFNLPSIKLYRGFYVKL